jgi:hypothetical protein
MIAEKRLNLVHEGGAKALALLVGGNGDAADHRRRAVEEDPSGSDEPTIVVGPGEPGSNVGKPEQCVVAYRVSTIDVRLVGDALLDNEDAISKMQHGIELDGLELVEMSDLAASIGVGHG